MNTMPIQIKRLVWYRRWIHSIIAVILGIAVLATDQAAFAWSYTTLQGRAGQVAMPSVLLSDIYAAGYMQFTVYSTGNAVAYRSPASSGIQNVAVIYYLEKWDGSQWVMITRSAPMKGQITASQQSIRFPGPYIQVNGSARGYFRLGALFQWATTTGVLLGNTAVNSNLATDYKCITTSRLCKSYPGYFRTGGFLTNAW